VAVPTLVAVAGCTAAQGTAAGGSGPPTRAAGETVSTSPGAPEESAEEPVATDGPRPTGTDVVLSTVTWNAAEQVLEAGGYVSPVVEDGGTCTLRVQQGTEVLTTSTPGLADATSTICGGLRTEPGALASGRWTVVLSYASDTARGESATTAVEVPR
jgi:hypothetical protein